MSKSQPMEATMKIVRHTALARQQYLPLPNPTVNTSRGDAVFGIVADI